MNDEGAHNVWRSYSDMMSGLLLLFVLIMAVCLMQAQKSYNDRLAEQAAKNKTQDELENTQTTLGQRESELEAQSMTLSQLQSTLEQQAAALSQKESELDASQASLLQKETELSERDTALAARDAALAASQKQLDEQTQLMATQQSKIDQIIGVKADLIESLNTEFKSNKINVNIDAQTGAIVLDSNVLFAFNEATLTEEGTKILAQVLPVYCQVLLGDQYKDYVAEIIIDGYTDSSGSYLSNLSLSQNRAYAVAEYLLNDSGNFLTDDQNKALAQKLTANGRSQSSLILDANGKEDADASRRVEIKFRLKDEEMIQELSQIIADSQNSTAGAQTDAAQTDAAQTNAAQTDAAQTDAVQTDAAQAGTAQTDAVNQTQTEAKQ